jgi:hypothetical protein
MLMMITPAACHCWPLMLLAADGDHSCCCLSPLATASRERRLAPARPAAIPGPPIPGASALTLASTTRNTPWPPDPSQPVPPAEEVHHLPLKLQAWVAHTRLFDERGFFLMSVAFFDERCAFARGWVFLLAFLFFLCLAFGGGPLFDAAPLSVD